MGKEHARWREQHTYGFEVEKNLEYLRLKEDSESALSEKRRGEQEQSDTLRSQIIPGQERVWVLFQE